MKILRQLFSKKRAPETFESKVKNLETQPQSTLEALAKGAAGDPNDIAIRKEALKRLPYTLVLRDVMQSGPSALEKTAREHVAQLLSTQQVSVKQLLQDIQETESLLAIAALSNNNELQDSVLTKITDENTLAQICENSNSAYVRKTLAERIEAPELLRNLAKALKNKDKNAYKVIKTKVDRIKAEEEQQEKIAAELASVCNDAEAHSKRALDKDYAIKLHRLVRRWSDVQAHATPEQSSRYKNALQICQQREQAKEDELEALAVIEANMSEADSNRKVLIQKIWDLTNGVLAWPAFEASLKSQAESSLQSLKEEWKGLKQFGNVMDAQLKQYTQVSEAVETLLLQYEQHGTLAEALIRVKTVSENEETNTADSQKDDIKYLRNTIKPFSRFTGFASATIIGEVKNYLQQLEEEQKAAYEEKQKHIRIIGGLIRKSNGAVDKGRLKQAIGIRHSIDEKLGDLQGLPAGMQTQLDNLDEAIQKLIDWQAYAVVPKKQALVEAMRELVGADLPAEALATKIKNLQDEWKELSQSGKDRKEDLWEEFSKLADQAFEPCKEHFQKLADVRQQNLEKRQELVKQLEAYVQQNDWDNADWRQVEKVLRSARQELHSYAPVDRAANKPVMDSFDAVMKVIQEKLEAEFEKNKNAKQQIITQAEALTDVADLQQAIDTAKRLQSQWKKIGRCAYKDNERLWKEFRKHCDAVFEKRDVVENAQKAELDNNLAVAQAFIDKMEALSSLSGDELLAARAERDQIKQDFAEVGALHPKEDKPVKRAFNQASENFEKAIKKALNAAELQAWTDMFKAAELVNAFILAGPENESLKQEAESFVDGVARWPDGGLAAVKAKFAADAGNAASNEKALRLLCIRAEILADVESPAEDKADRMAYQVELLQQGMGQQAVLANEQNAANLGLEWVAAGPVDSSTYQALFHRFHSSLEKLL
ncbi:hypothetical protein TDB9533_02458 [Thalassocella blandensis]|nr:hypothetical protein TDB9533_02458 [Thalassocella blandensis]